MYVKNKIGNFFLHRTLNQFDTIQRRLRQIVIVERSVCVSEEAYSRQTCKLTIFNNSVDATNICRALSG